jgi:uncharacterized protein YggE
MNRLVFILVPCALTSAIALAQTLPAPRPSVRAIGNASVFATPDKAQIDATVTTHAMTAQMAGSQNATQVAAVLSALTQLLGPGANIKTINYSITPNYNYPPNGGTPTLTGFTASNTVEVTLNNITTVGAIIDAATQAGATSVAGIRFSLQDPEPSRRQALQLAAVAAKSHADAMATALGGTVGMIVLLQEGSTVQPVVGTVAAAGAATTTPIESGLIQVDGTVTLEALLN